MLRKIIFVSIFLLSCLWSFSALANQLRVCLVNKQTTAEISCDDEFEVVDGKHKYMLPKGKYFLHNYQGRIKFSDKYIFNNKIKIYPKKDKALPKVNKKTYQGILDVKLQNDLLLVVNNIDLEVYLSSVLPEKTMVVWPEEVIKAQAVAARTYALYKQENNKNQDYDLLAADEELTYLGTGKDIEKASITKLINSTSGQYLIDTSKKPIKAVTTSSSGGFTESAMFFYGENLSYLPSVKDYDSDSPDYRWKHSVKASVLKNLLEQRGYVLGNLQSIQLSALDNIGSDRTATGRVKYLIFTGSQGSAKVLVQDIVDLLSLNSRLFDISIGVPLLETLKVPIENNYGFEIGSKEIDINLQENNKSFWENMLPNYHMLSGNEDEMITFSGKGKGNGVGLSAWGARGLANSDANVDYKYILSYYYPKTSLIY